MRSLVSCALVLAGCVACGRAYDEGASAAAVPAEADGGADGAADALAQPVDASAVTSDGAATDMDGATDPLADRARIFVTSSKFTGALGGIVGADAKCAAAAAQGKLGGVYRAWLSTTSAGAYSRIPGNGPWYRVDGTLVFSTRGALVLGPTSPPLEDENGVPVADFAIWTGTTASGGTSGTTCEEWGGLFGNGTVGRADSVSPGWSATGELPCSNTVHLLCLRAF